MYAERFIAGKLRFKGRLAIVAIACSFLVIIISITVSAGFRREIRDGVSMICGDIQLGGQEPVCSNPSYLSRMEELEGVESITPVVYRTGIIKGQKDIQGVMFKGVPADSSASLEARIPSRLAKMLSLEVGDQMLTYFISDKVKLRKFKIAEIYSGILDADDKMVVYVPLADMQRLNAWDSTQVSCLEVILDSRHKDPASMRERAAELGSISILYSNDDEDSMIARAAVDMFPQLFDWLGLIDFNVLAILFLMIVVAGFNMISGLLILLFRHISTIGRLKAMGMGNKSIASVFLRVASRIVLLGMAIGNGLGLLFCFIQDSTHLIKLNPANYFVSFVPVSVDLPLILAADLIAYLAIMIMMLLPSLFIAKVDPAETVRVQ